ncbi:hypothetical protein NO1_1234 [Candidatus Termititenax aidoneus]|uniref:Uncharacterized protein n=1 Tax=Termititenax aidoneus TaxID=2218524 RepID=A0A388TC12_TERA1|nr:hypothetical protein NO1_1234 [Candidatus Termititenax aidoneus]
MTGATVNASIKIEDGKYSAAGLDATKVYEVRIRKNSDVQSNVAAKPRFSDTVVVNVDASTKTFVDKVIEKKDEIKDALTDSNAAAGKVYELFAAAKDNESKLVDYAEQIRNSQQPNLTVLAHNTKTIDGVDTDWADNYTVLFDADYGLPSNENPMAQYDADQNILKVQRVKVARDDANFYLLWEMPDGGRFYPKNDPDHYTYNLRIYPAGYSEYDKHERGNNGGWLAHISMGLNTGRVRDEGDRQERVFKLTAASGLETSVDGEHAEFFYQMEDVDGLKKEEGKSSPYSNKAAIQAKMVVGDDKFEMQVPLDLIKQTLKESTQLKPDYDNAVEIVMAVAKTTYKDISEDYSYEGDGKDSSRKGSSRSNIKNVLLVNFDDVDFAGI